MHTIQNTLYVMTPQAYAHLDNATVRIEVERETRLRVPLHHIGGLVCFGNVLVSPALMHRLADEGKSLVLLDNSGRFKARLEGAGLRQHPAAPGPAPSRPATPRSPWRSPAPWSPASCATAAPSSCAAPARPPIPPRRRP